MLTENWKYLVFIMGALFTLFRFVVEEVKGKKVLFVMCNIYLSKCFGDSWISLIQQTNNMIILWSKLENLRKYG